MAEANTETAGKKKEQAPAPDDQELQILVDKVGKKLSEKIYDTYIHDEDYSRFPAFMLALDSLIADFGGQPVSDDEEDEGDQEEEEKKPSLREREEADAKDDAEYDDEDRDVEGEDEEKDDSDKPKKKGAAMRKKTTASAADPETVAIHTFLTAALAKGE